MKLSNMALVFVLVIIPILLVFSLYVDNQLETIEQQTNYDTKIMAATKDAIESLEMNTFGKITKYNAATMRRTIQAAVKAFINSYSANFAITGYDENDILTYVPALLFTMYDGIYIYGPTTDQQDIENAPESNYENYVLKPYIYYSARYKNDDWDNKYDVVINYSLDNYITITGTVGSGTKQKYISKSGYLIDNDTLTINTQDNVTGVTVKNKEGESVTIPLHGESLYEKITFYEEDYNLDGEINDSDADYASTEKMRTHVEKVISGKIEPTPVTLSCQYTYKVEDKQKYYFYTGNEYPQYRYKWFKYNAVGKVVKEGTKETIQTLSVTDTSAKRFYQEAYEFSKFIQDLGVKITPNSIVKPDGTPVLSLDDDNLRDPYYIFKGDNTNVLDAKGDKDYFLQHKLNIMKVIITDNLNVAISSYSNDAYMPEISETEWEKILTNISMVSFFQGMPMGLKTYNNYAIAVSTNNEMYVGEDSIYYVIKPDIESKNGYHHKTNCKVLNNDTKNIIRGYASTEFDKHTVNYMTEYYLSDTKEFKKTDHYLYYYQHHSLDCYDCIISSEEGKNEEKEILDAKIHAIARIKHNQIKTTERVNNKVEIE